MSGMAGFRVMHVITALGTGGAELKLLRLAQELKDRHGAEQIIVSLGPVTLDPAQLAEVTIRIESLDMRGGWDVFRALRDLVRLMRRWQPDAVQSWMYHADFTAGFAARFAGIRSLYWGIRCVELPSDSGRVTWALVRLCARLSRVMPKRIICCAEAARRAHIAKGYHAPKMEVIPNGYDLRKLTYSDANRAWARQLFAVSKERIVIGLVARFDPLKDHRTFIEAARQVGADFDHVDFVLIGGGIDADNRELTCWIAAAGLSDRMRLLGRRDDVATLLSGFDIFCLSSTSEGFPNVLAEAMAVGVPCVSTDVGEAAVMLDEVG